MSHPGNRLTVSEFHASTNPSEAVSVWLGPRDYHAQDKILVEHLGSSRVILVEHVSADGSRRRLDEIRY